MLARIAVTIRSIQPPKALIPVMSLADDQCVDVVRAFVGGDGSQGS